MQRKIQQSFAVQVEYPVFFLRGLFAQPLPDLGEWISTHSEEQPIKVLVVADKGLLKAQPALENQIRGYFSAWQGLQLMEVVRLAGGEQAKNKPQALEALLASIEKRGLSRHSFLIGLGGGAVLDVAGYAAAIAHRGIRHIRIPTTVLAQNDSGVGVKNGVNAFGAKNFLGTFQPPHAVFNDSAFLPSLDARDWRGGMAEAVKVALVKDADFFAWLEQNAEALRRGSLEPMEQLVERCAALHLNHIASGDPFEQGSSRPLDFGHWAAHQLEQLSAYRIGHGEAVAAGIALDALYSQEKLGLPAEAAERVLRLFERLGLPLFYPEMADEKLLEGLERFRQHLGGQLTVMQLEAIGKGREVHDMDPAIIRRALNRLRETAPASLKG